MKTSFTQKHRAALSGLFRCVRWLLTFAIALSIIYYTLGMCGLCVAMVIGIPIVVGGLLGGAGYVMFSELIHLKSTIHFVEEGKGNWYVVATRLPFYWRRKVAYIGEFLLNPSVLSSDSLERIKERFEYYLDKARQDYAKGSTRQMVAYTPKAETKHIEHMLSLLGKLKSKMTPKL